MFEISFPRKPADVEIAILFLDIGHSRNPVDVDEITGPGKPELHHGDKTLPAAQDFGVISVLLKKSDRFRNGLRTKILKGWRDHRVPLPSRLLFRLLDADEKS